MEEIWGLLREDAIILEAKFRKASAEGKGTSQEVADFREHALQDLVQRFFPFPFRVTKGKVRDSFGAIADSVDCVVCNPTHPFTVDSHGKFSILLAEGVESAIEVKPDLSQLVELNRGLEQGLSIKKLRRSIVPVLEHSGWGYERASRVPFVIFAMKCKADPLNTGREIIDFYRERAVAPLDQADFIAVNGVGIFMNNSNPAQNAWNVRQPPDAPKAGWYFEEWAENTLAGLIWRLQDLAPSAIRMQQGYFKKYLHPIGGKLGVSSVRYIGQPVPIPG